MNQKIIDFYNGVGTDSAGRSIEQIWAFDDIALEGAHTYIQWLFPSSEPSFFNPDAPLLDEETIDVFRTSSELQDKVLQSFDVMLRFLHLKMVGMTISPKDESLFWVTWKNHNYRRLTRIMSFLRLAGLESYAWALHAELKYIANETEAGLVIDDETLRFWDVAAGVIEP